MNPKSEWGKLIVRYFPELAPLQAIRNNYPKTPLTLDRVDVGLDRVDVGGRGGIRQENIIDWMLSGAWPTTSLMPSSQFRQENLYPRD